jgi:hypothetical protein
MAAPALASSWRCRVNAEWGTMERPMMKEYDTDPSDCNHSDIVITGYTPDSFGVTMYDDSDDVGSDTGFQRMHAYDARCEDYGANGNVVYRFERLEDFR